MGRNGSIREASETSYEITFSYRGERCRERVKLKPSSANLRRIGNWLGAIQDSIDKGTFDYSVTFPDSPRRLKFIDNLGQGLLLSEYLDSWIEAKKKTIKASTYLSYTKIIKLIIKQFIGKYISDIKRPSLKQWLKGLNSSNKNLTNIQSVLRSALKDAVDDEIIETNPLNGWKYTNNEAPKKADDVDPFTADEQTDILNELTDQNRNMYTVFFWTGLRPSELIALDWDDIDWRRGVIKVTKALTQAAAKCEEPKTEASNREIKILEPAMQAIVSQKSYTYLKNKEIFQNPKTGERWIGDRPIRNGVWRPALRRTKVRYRRPYQTRHTYASMMLTADESIAWLAGQMGHRDWGMLRNRYAKFIKDSMPEAGSKALELFGKKAGIKAGNTSTF